MGVCAFTEGLVAQYERFLRTLTRIWVEDNSQERRPFGILISTPIRQFSWANTRSGWTRSNCLAAIVSLAKPGCLPYSNEGLLLGGS